MKELRSNHPKRTCKTKYKNYRSYKEFLRKDFKKCCGYCDDTDVYCGGQNAFHIDHFRPLKHYSNLECEYSNLVYACSYCNISKSDDWPCLGSDLTYNNGAGYIDPCDSNFASHFERHDNGQIRPKTDVGKYMFEQLKLGLLRHELIWMLKELFTKIKEISEMYKQHKHGPKANALMNKHMELTDEYIKYKELYEDVI